MPAQRTAAQVVCQQHILTARLALHTEHTTNNWRWTAAIGRGGYGLLTVYTPKKRSVKAHIVAWFIATGEWPKPGELVCHDCPGGDTPNCIRNDGPETTYTVAGVSYRKVGHLWLGNARANVADRDAKGRTATGDRTGLRKHPERAARGDRHGSRTHPGAVPRGDRNGARTHPETRRRGERNPHATFTEADVRNIRARYATGAPPTVIARDYNRPLSGIMHIVKRRSWKHIEDYPYVTDRL